MKVCRTLSVNGTTAALRALLKDIRQRRPGGWRHEDALSDELSIFLRTPGTCPGDQMVIFGFLNDTRMIVANVHTTPDWPGDFTMDLFNEILCHFAASLQPLVAKWGVTMTIGENEGHFQTMMSAPTYQALELFAAQRGQPSSLVDVTWSRFLTLIHFEQCLIRPPEIAEWLAGQGWPDDECQRWASDFTRGLTTLDVRAAMADHVKVIRLADLPSASAHLQ